MKSDDKEENRGRAAEDIVQFLKEKKGGNFIVKTISWPGPLRFRARALAALLQGAFSPLEFPRLILPTARRPHDLDQRFADYVNRETKNAVSRFMNADGSISLLGKSFDAPLGNYYEMISLLDEIVVSDQYHAQAFERNIPA